LQQHPTTAARQMAVLDGLVTNLSARLSIVANVAPNDAQAIVREEFLAVLLTKADAFEYRSGDRRGGNDDSTSRPKNARLVFSEDGANDGGNTGTAAAASTRLLLDRTKLVLAVCTVLHRLIVCGADGDALPAAIAGAVSAYLRYVYDGSYQDGFDVGADDGTGGGGGAGSSNGSGSGSGSGGSKRVGFNEEDEDEDDDNEDDEDDEDEFTTTTTAQVISLPRIGDTVAVNLLILLEEASSFVLATRRSYSFSSVSNDILKSLRGGFGEDLLLSPPLTVTSDAAMFVRQEQLRVVAETRRRKRRMKKKRGGAAIAVGAGGGGGVEYVPLLDAGAKLMLILALWDLVERLSV